MPEGCNFLYTEIERYDIDNVGEMLVVLFDDTNGQNDRQLVIYEEVDKKWVEGQYFPLNNVATVKLIRALNHTLPDSMRFTLAKISILDEDETTSKVYNEKI